MAVKHKCPICGIFDFEEFNSLEICEVCGWQDDAVQEKYPDSTEGANSVSFNEAKKNYSEKKYVK